MKNTEETIEQQLDRIAKEVARRYAARCWWADPTDLHQQAWVVVLEVLRSGPPRLENGELDRAKLGGFAWVAAMRQLSRYLWRLSAPVSASDHEVKDLAGIHHYHVDPRLPDDYDVESIVHLCELRSKIRGRILQLCGYKDVDPWMDAVLRVLMDGEKPAEVRATLGLPTYGIYRHTEWVKFRITNDELLRELCAELAERRN